MIDMDDEKLKAEIDEIMKSVDSVMRRIEDLGLIKNEDPSEIKNEG
jgi:hypothetical protein